MPWPTLIFTSTGMNTEANQTVLILDEFAERASARDRKNISRFDG